MTFVTVVSKFLCKRDTTECVVGNLEFSISEIQAVSASYALIWILFTRAQVASLPPEYTLALILLTSYSIFLHHSSLSSLSVPL